MLSAYWPSSFADETGARLSLKYKNYGDNNDVVVSQPSINATIPLHKNVAARGHMLVDAISAASRRAYNPKSKSEEYNEIGIPPDAITSASIDRRYPPFGIRDPELPVEYENAISPDAVTKATTKEERYAGGGGLIFRLLNTIFNFDISYSRESDYESWRGTIGGKKEINNSNTQISFQYSRFEDQIKAAKSSFASIELGYKAVDNISVSFVQTIDEQTELSAIWNMAATNYLPASWNEKGDKVTGRIYYPVRLDVGPGGGGHFYSESYPETKLLHAGSIGAKRIINSFYRYAALDIAYRRYWDTWGMSSNTYSAEISQYIWKNIILSAKYRFYSQTQTDFYRDVYTKNEVFPKSGHGLSYITVDSRLSAFDAHLAQAKITWLFSHPINTHHQLFAFYPLRWEFEMQYYNRTTHPDAFIRRQRFEFYDEDGLKAWLFRTGLVFSY